MAEKTKTKGRLSPLTVGIASTAAVAAGVAAVALSNKDNRKKAGKMLKDLKNKSGDLTKRASEGLDRVLKEEKNVREKVQKLRTKAGKINGAKASKSKTTKKSTTSSRSASSKNGSQTRSV
ncbi:MAG TPA: hypothetical protein VM077_03060 [Candidatus Limnocylindrales bacterium]|nr:hypothetical protein [Candidatus Limnocylindrales bacterium]